MPTHQLRGPFRSAPVRRATRLAGALLALGLFAAPHALPGATPAQEPVPAPPAAPAADLVIRGGSYFTGEAMARNTGIVVLAGKLMAVDAGLTDADLAAARAAGTRVLELGDDEYVLPGFFDLHAHYGMDLFAGPRVDEYTVNPVVFLANGVTSTFPAGEMDPEAMRGARCRIDAGLRVGSRILNSGPYFGTARPGWDTAMTAEQLHAEVDRWAARGAAGFKAKRIGPRLLAALIERAHRHGLTVTGHLGSGYRNTVNPRDAIRMGIDRIEHFLGGDALPADRSAYASLVEFEPGSPEFERIVDLYRRHNVYFDATVTAYGYFGERDPRVYTKWVDEMKYLAPEVRDSVEARLPRRVNEQFERIYRVKLETVKAFHDAGAGHLLTLGTDHPSWGEFLSGFSVHRELHAFVVAGIPPAAALRAATINAARAIGRGDRFGAIEPGRFADLVVVRGDPLDDIRNTRNVRRVVKAGEVYDPAALLASVEGRLDPRDQRRGAAACDALAADVSAGAAAAGAASDPDMPPAVASDPDVPLAAPPTAAAGSYEQGRRP